LHVSVVRLSTPDARHRRSHTLSLFPFMPQSSPAAISATLSTTTTTTTSTERGNVLVPNVNVTTGNITLVVNGAPLVAGLLAFTGSDTPAHWDPKQNWWVHTRNQLHLRPFLRSMDPKQNWWVHTRNQLHLRPFLRSMFFHIFMSHFQFFAFCEWRGLVALDNMITAPFCQVSTTADAC
jgi:hypothetical protein